MKLGTARHVKLLGLIVVCALILYFAIRGTINLRTVKIYSEHLRLLTNDYYGIMVSAYMLFFALAVMLCLPIAPLFTVLGGFLFGTMLGVIYTNIGATLGAIAGFVVIRYAIGGWIQRRYRQRLHRFNEELKEGQASYLLALHLIPVIPFSVINILAGLADISLWTFTWTTSVGITPILFVYSYAGQQLARITRLSQLLSWQIVAGLMGLSVLALLPVIVRWTRRAPKIRR